MGCAVSSTAAPTARAGVPPLGPDEWQVVASMAGSASARALSLTSRTTRAAVFAAVRRLDSLQLRWLDGGAGWLCRYAALLALGLSDLGLRTEHFEALACAVGSLPQLALLDISHNARSDDISTGAGLNQGFGRLLEALLASCPNLEVLDASANALGTGGAISAAAELLRRSDSLRRLRLCDNLLGAAGGAAVASALGDGAAALQELDCGWNEIGDDGAEQFGVALRFGAPRLVRLDLSGNRFLAEGRIGPRGVDALLAALHEHVALRMLDLNGCRSTDAQRTAAASSSRYRLAELDGDHAADELTSLCVYDDAFEPPEHPRVAWCDANVDVTNGLLCSDVPPRQLEQCSTVQQ